MVRSRDVVQAEGSARTEGARRATGVRADGAAAGAGSLAPGQRWSASRKHRRGAAAGAWRTARGAVLRRRALSSSPGQAACRRADDRAHVLARRQLGLKDRHVERSQLRVEGARRGEAAHRGAVDGGRAAPRAGAGSGAAPPFGDAEVATMSATTSAATGRCFGIQRVCQV